ncbi:MAG: type III pantothenate kinase [Dysgonamonadaceae bacterium]|nr:type III pantothenate kinase [Dysgonamonadaceae bacterium]
MNIVIDQGNTSAKIALFEGKTLLDSFHFESLTKEILLGIISEHPVEQGILSAVKQIDKNILSYLDSHLSFFFELCEQTLMPLILEYKTPHTLGRDRIAAATGAHMQKPDENLLVIDIGTAITFDFVNKEGHYKGGNISPGPELRFKALHHFTDRLPLIDEKGDIPVLGYDTATAIRSGVMKGIAWEIDSYIRYYKKKCNVFTFLTGGYSFYFESKLKNPIFADENLVLKGLNEILNYQYA